MVGSAASVVKAGLEGRRLTRRWLAMLQTKLSAGQMGTERAGKESTTPDLGGDGRPERIPQIQAAFALAEVHWDALPKHAPRALASSIDRIKAGRYDLVVCLQRFVSHDITDAVWGCDGACAMRVLAASYGIGQLQRAFERFLPHP